MRIEKKRIRNAANYTSHLSNGQRFRVVGMVTSPTVLARMGFPDDAEPGATILPKVKGSQSRYNAEGRYVPRRDLPKETRYVRTVRWIWREFCGRNDYVEREDFRDIHRSCYQREHVPPPGIELTLVEHEGQRLVASPLCEHGATPQAYVRDAINLILEFFGGCEIVREDLQPFVVPPKKRLAWALLPPGDHPWPQLKQVLLADLNRTSANTQAVVLDRQETILSHGPSQTYVGRGGFSDYVAYEFEDRSVVVLESVRRGNAIYVFGKGWQAFSQMTKAEILREGYHIERIVHTSGWKARLAGTLRAAEAA